MSYNNVLFSINNNKLITENILINNWNPDKIKLNSMSKYQNSRDSSLLEELGGNYESTEIVLGFNF